MVAEMQEQLLRYINVLKNNVQKQDPTTISVLVATLVVFLTLGNNFLIILSLNSVLIFILKYHMVFLCSFICYVC